MSIPTGDNAFLHELELDVRAELNLIETSQPEEEAVGVPIDEWLSDPADDQRYEVYVRSLLERRRGSGGRLPPRPVHRDGRSVSDAGHATARGGNHVARFLAQYGITKDELIIRREGSP